MTELLVIGAGLTGLYAAGLAAAGGARVTLAARGEGSLALLPVRMSNIEHPYLEKAIHELQQMAPDIVWGRDEEYILPTAAGSIQRVNLAPQAQVDGDLQNESPLTIAGLEGFRDFSPHLIANNLGRSFPGREFNSIVLPLPDPQAKRDHYSTDLARRFGDPVFRAKVISLWKPLLNGVECLALPAVLGFEGHLEAFSGLKTNLNLSWLCEIPTIPPSVPGLRLQRILLNHLRSLEVNILIGSPVRGKIEGGLATAQGITYAGARTLNCEAVLLATGGLLHGGLEAEAGGQICETVFNLPIEAPSERSAWFHPQYLQSQPCASFGLVVDERMQPVLNGNMAAENLYAAGSILAGGDRTLDGSRMAISLSSAYQAVKSILA